MLSLIIKSVIMCTVTVMFLLCSQTALSQNYYEGVEAKCITLKNGKKECYDWPRRWFSLNTVKIENDTFYMYKTPFSLHKGERRYSASDGAFYYMYGVIIKKASDSFMVLTMYNCEYCHENTYRDPKAGFHFPLPHRDTLKFVSTKAGFKIGKIHYKKVKDNTVGHFPQKQRFLFDSNKIYRINPESQYKLISTSIKHFLDTKDLVLDEDTIRICRERVDYDRICEILNPDSIHIGIHKYKIVFYNESELVDLSRIENRVIRYIKINRITDYWRTSSISLHYKIIIPKNTISKSEKEYFNRFEYYKINGKYKMIGKLPENSWGIVQ